MGRTGFSVSRGYHPTVRIPDEYLNCVAFIGEVAAEDATGVHGDPYATGFFVSLPADAPGMEPFLYFITAKHVANDLAGHKLCFFVNKLGGGVTTFAGIGDDHWWLHPEDKTTDVAVVPVFNPPGVSIAAVDLREFALPGVIEQLVIGIGDEVFAVGLFTEVIGTTRNWPVVRHGNIAMMPTEQIDTELGYADVYLVEARSLGGLSGSPVFVRNTGTPSNPDKVRGSGIMFGTGKHIKLLGLMHGHWDIKESEMNKPFFTHDRKHGVNYGVAIVVPAMKIFETLYRAELIQMRETLERRAQSRRRNVPGMDSAKQERETQVTPEGAEIPIPTQEQFLRDLTKASRRVKPD